MRSAGFSLIELLTTVAALTIVLGLMVSLARYVRARSAETLTRDVLARLDVLLEDHVARTGGLPDVPPLLPADATATDLPAEDQLRLRASANNAEFVHALRGDMARFSIALREMTMSREGGRPPRLTTGPTTAVTPNRRDRLAGLPGAVYNEASLRDAWGGPVVYMPHGHPLIGSAAGDRPFFFSAGPDRAYLTRDDNVYSYEAKR